MSRRVLAGAVAAVALLATAAMLFVRDTSPTSERPTARSDPGAPRASVAARQAEESPSLPPLPASLHGVDVAGALPVDAEGHLLVVPDVLDLFDGFLAASGEEPLSVIRSRIEAEIAARLDPPADAEARALLERYLAYRDEARALADAVGDALPLERRFQLIRELRRANFGRDDAEALFGAEEARVRVDLERRRVARDPTLSEDERAARLDQLEAELPESVRETRQAVLAASRLQEEEQRLRSAGAGPDEIQALREREVGPDAAGRLAALDAQRAGFDARLTAYRRERAELTSRVPEGSKERDAALAELRAAHFAGAERRRVEALDRIEESMPASDASSPR